MCVCVCVFGCRLVQSGICSVCIQRKPAVIYNEQSVVCRVTITDFNTLLTGSRARSKHKNMRLFHRAVFEKHFVKFCTLFAPPLRYFHWSNLCSSFHTDDGRHVYEAEQIPQKTHDKIRINLMNVLKLKKMIIYLLSHTWFCEQITVFDVSYIISTTLEMSITIWTIKWIIHNK